MSKSKTPVADKYVAEYHERLKGTGCTIAGQEIEALRAIELELLNTKEQTPTKAVEVLKVIDDLVNKKVEERETSTLLAHKSILDYEYLNKEIKLEAAYKKEKADFLAKQKEMVDALVVRLDGKDKDYRDLVTKHDALQKELKRDKSEYVKDFIAGMILNTASYETISIPVNKFLGTTTVKVSKQQFIEFFYDRFSYEGLI